MAAMPAAAPTATASVGEMSSHQCRRRRAGAQAPLAQIHRTIQDAVDAVSAGEVSLRD
jgi:hypothetical protein